METRVLCYLLTQYVTDCRFLKIDFFPIIKCGRLSGYAAGYYATCRVQRGVDIVVAVRLASCAGLSNPYSLPFTQTTVLVNLTGTK